MYDKDFLASGQGLEPEAGKELDREQNRQWEENHKLVMDCINDYMQSRYKIPTVTYISEKTGLSRPAIYKHLHGFSDMPEFRDHVAIFKLLSTNILRQVYSQAMWGEVKAAKFFLEIMGIIKKNELVENNFLTEALTPKVESPEEKTQRFLDGLTPSLRDTLEAVMRERERRAKEKEENEELQA